MKQAPALEAARLLAEGIAHLDQAQNQDALNVLTKAAKLNPQDHHLWCVLGHAEERMGHIEAGRQCFIRAHKLAPDYPLALRNLAAEELNNGNAATALSLADKAVAINPMNEEVVAIMLLAATTNLAVDAETLYQRHVRAKEYREAAIVALPPVARTSNSIIRIGYFSHHFYRFPLASFLPHVMAAHDRKKFHVSAFAAHGRVDDITHQYINSVDSFHDLSTMNDDEAAAYIRQEKIDILIDTSGLVQFNRFGILARRPACVQMSWLGYFASTASPAIDAHITDNFANPLGITEHLFSEKLLRLPHSQYAYKPMVADVEVAPLPQIKNGYVTFGWFCATSKLNADALAVYAAIVAKVVDSRILFVATSKDLRAEIQRVFAKAGVARHRIIFSPYLAPADYFRALTSVDICLDCFPMVGGTAVCDAIWMGTPIISMFQARGFGGAAASVLNHVGMAHWIALDVAGFVDNAVALANDGEALRGYRANLRDKIKQSPLMNVHPLTAMLEDIYKAAIKT